MLALVEALAARSDAVLVPITVIEYLLGYIAPHRRPQSNRAEPLQWITAVLAGALG